MSRKYNRKIYARYKNINSKIRDRCSPNPTETLGVFGFIGKVLGFIIKYMIAKPIHWLTFAIVGLFYDKRTDKPYKGSSLYTIVFIVVKILVCGIISNLARLFY